MAEAAVQRGYEQEFDRLLETSSRFSFRILCWAYLVLGLIDLAFLAGRQTQDSAQATALVTWRVAGIAAGLLTLAVAIYFGRGVNTRRSVHSYSTGLMVIVGLLVILPRVFLEASFPQMVWWCLADILIVHVVACAIVPWTWRESIQGVGPLLLVWGVAVLVRESPWDMFSRVVAVMLSPGVLVPGAMVAVWRAQRAKDRFDRDRLGRQVKSLGSELSRARIVHDAMFPRPIDQGHITFEYEYVPFQDIGGDYVHLHVCRDTGRVYLTVLDVAGHGLAAALTVNRLFGELERIRAENNEAEPAEVMELLNRYIHLTMARLNLYATGTCIMVNTRTGELKWVNAGHPPAFVRRANGEVIDLPTTCLLLGVENYAEFDPNEQSVKINPGDAVIAYTDGAFECRDKKGKRFGIEQLRSTACFQPAPRSWSKFIATAVSKHHGGDLEDDILIAALTLRSLSVPMTDDANAADDVDDALRPRQQEHAARM